MNRGYNYGAGPAGLPDEVLLEAQKELMNWQGLGMSVMEMGHRTKPIMTMMEEAEQLLRELLKIPNNYHVLFLHGPARMQFSMIPLNLLDENQQAAYLVTGAWSSMAYDEAVMLKKAYCAASSQDSQFTTLPLMSGFNPPKDTAYFYYTPNETIHGVRCPMPSNLGAIPVVADMTSCFLSEPIDINKYGLIFAGAQKNIANTGLVVAIIRDDLVKGVENKTIPSVLNYHPHVVNKSLYATPPTFNCYIAYKMFQWISRHGGVDEMQRLSIIKSKKLYDYIDASSYYQCKVSKEARSLMNVCFSMINTSLENTFIEEAESQGLLALKGHQLLGGFRASIYNSMPVSGVDKLINFMDDFSKKHPI